MNRAILNIENQDFINSNLDSNTVQLLLQNTDSGTVRIKELVEQIEAKNKCKSKLPTWYNTPQIYFPNKLNIEQTSSEITAEYKSNLVKGNTLIDLTGGFGVDSFCFSKQFKHVTHCEIDPNLSEIVTHNFKTLGVNNVTTLPIDGVEYLEHSSTTFDCIYIDPSRRHDSKGKVFYLSDCLPNVIEHIDMLLEHSKTIMIKASPMLDISMGFKELKWVKEVHIVAINNEVKELLFLIEKNFKNNINIKTINVTNTKNQILEFALETEKESISSYGLPKKYLYEPNSAILKAGAFNTISKSLTIDKLHKHSHLYTSETLIEFPGRRFEITEVIPYNKKVITKRFSKSKCNVITRNFPETVAQLRSKFKMKDGGNLFVFFTTNENNEKIVIVTSQLKK